MSISSTETSKAVNSFAKSKILHSDFPSSLLLPRIQYFPSPTAPSMELVSSEWISETENESDPSSLVARQKKNAYIALRRVHDWKRTGIGGKSYDAERINNVVDDIRIRRRCGIVGPRILRTRIAPEGTNDGHVVANSKRWETDNWRVKLEKDHYLGVKTLLPLVYHQQDWWEPTYEHNFLALFSTMGAMSSSERGSFPVSTFEWNSLIHDFSESWWARE